uniref:BMERB domain-containing protein n=1 Tax=Knipowitschia caucasica TaxID=637954 RepID=A0AAV2KHI6_KNICA
MPSVKSEEDRSQTKPVVVRRLAEQNCNNNNKRPFTIRSADRRFEDEPSLSEDPSLRHRTTTPIYKTPHPGHQHSAGPWTVSLGPASTNTQHPSNLESIHQNGTRSTGAHSDAKPGDGQVQTRPVASEPELKGAFALPEHTALISAAPDLCVPVNRVPSPPVPPSALAPAPAPAPAPLRTVSSPLFIPAAVSAHRPATTSANLGVKLGNYPAVKSPPRRPAVDSINSAAQTNHGNPSGAKKGKYFSCSTASETEMRSPPMSCWAVRLQQVDKELVEVETRMVQLEKDGVELEKRLRRCEEEGREDILMDPLMVDWFNLIREKQMYIRKESELVYIARTLELERQQPGVEGELRRLLEKPEHLKSHQERQREQQLMQKLVEIVNGRNAIVEGLDEDRRREFEEDQQLNEMMKSLGLKKAKTKRKSSISKMFRRRSKRRVE